MKNTSFDFGSNAVQLASGGNTAMAEQGKKKIGTNVPANETTPQKLARLANKRVNKAITQIRLIGNLGAYSPTQAQRELICKAVDAEVTKMKANLNSDTPVTVEGFKLA